ncbi:MAG: permease of phosphate ABC transporter [Huintestinicola sp.]|uniref:permease of phosphate ABC transporter n=1 Tax=Huintestinicola sp. TaxID=2981661 RepID=UPI003F086D76
MQKLFEYAEKYIEGSSWKDLALIKFCLCAMGIIIGANIAPKHKKAVTAAAAGVFVLTYIPLMAKFFKIVFGCDKALDEEK